jgi:epoxyqueuosine reductase QueG
VILLESEGNVVITDGTATDRTLVAELREKAMSQGASYFGVADLNPVKSYIADQGDDFLADYPVGVSVGVALVDGVVDQLYQHLNSNVARTYRHHIYSVVGEHLDRLAEGLAFTLEGNGYRAIPVPSSGYYDDVRLRGLISHKLVANLAGHGWIGKNCLLITKTHGPRVRWVTILTDAPLKGTGGAPVIVDHCKNCNLCVDLCPMQAFTGVKFNPEDPVEVRFDTHKCRQYLRGREKTHGASVCGICVHVCPHGWSMKRKKKAGRTTANLLRERLAGMVSAMPGNS